LHYSPAWPIVSQTIDPKPGVNFNTSSLLWASYFFLRINRLQVARGASPPNSANTLSEELLKASERRHTIAPSLRRCSCSVIAAVPLGRNPVLIDAFDSKKLDPGLKPAGVTYGG
jgi:hypothetical protein